MRHFAIVILVLFTGCSPLVYDPIPTTLIHGSLVASNIEPVRVTTIEEDEAINVFDRIIEAEGLGVDTQRTEGGELPPNVLTRADFARQEVSWCSEEDTDEFCENEFKNALYLYGKAFSIEGGFLCDGMTRKACMDEGRSTGWFPGTEIVTLTKADQLVEKKISKEHEKNQDQGRKIRLERRQRDKSRSRSNQ